MITDWSDTVFDFYESFGLYLDTKIVIYADDVQFLHLGSSSSIHELQSAVKGTLRSASHWFIQNCLRINPIKTDLLVMKSRRRRLSVRKVVL